MNQFIAGLEMIQDFMKLKWVPEILIAIDEGSQRYSKILANVEYISHTELQRKLNVLIQKKVVYKEEEKGHSIYKLSEFGDDIVHMIRHFVELGNKYSA